MPGGTLLENVWAAGSTTLSSRLEPAGFLLLQMSGALESSTQMACT